ncbi:hypothetical protein [Catelliglobosispora koreensis]|uniref:hypothetical protein n=1 Tax=Catelliglobosispora koreensis TaxID=129052 RepID=UPI0003789187|nr:hypothetical protein [Catelliglobosispora koreensis]
MTTTPTAGGFTGELDQAFAPAAAGGCCGSAPSATATAETPAATSPCCGTAAEATEAGSCCGTAAKAEAVEAGKGCCG